MKLEIRNAVLGYRRQEVLRGVNFEVSTGRTVCVIGRNGAGKTTFFKSLLGVLPLLDGEILLDGRDIGSWSRAEFARTVAYIPQVRMLPFPFKVSDVVLFGRTAHLGVFASPGKRDRIIADECLERLNISHLRERIFTQLSGGEQQLVIVARALAQQPSFLIMDEPASSLDFGNQINLLSQINRLKSSSLGILMATHSPDHAFACDADVVVVQDGEVRRQDSCRTVITETLLKQVYGVEVDIKSFMDERSGKMRTMCMAREM